MDTQFLMASPLMPLRSSVEILNQVDAEDRLKRLAGGNPSPSYSVVYQLKEYR